MRFGSRNLNEGIGQIETLATAVCILVRQEMFEYYEARAAIQF